MTSALFILNFALRLPQQEPPSGDWLARLLGLDRVNLAEGEWHIGWQHPLQLWFVVLVLIPFLAGIVWMLYRRERKDVATGTKLLLTSLRSALLLLITLLLFGPKISVEIRHPRKSHLLLLLDDSLSMLKKDPPSDAAEQKALALATGITQSPDQTLTQAQEEEVQQLSRIEIVRRLLSNPRLKILDQLEEKILVDYFTFSRNARKITDRGEFLATLPAGTETAVGDSISQAQAQLRGQQVDGIVVVSDGQSNSGSDPIGVVRELARQRRIPVYTIAPGIRSRHRNIQLSELQARNTVLAEDRLEVKFKTSAAGFEGTPVDVELHACPIPETLREAPTDPAGIEKLLATGKKELERRVTLLGEGRRQEEMIQYQPKTPGHYLLVLKIHKQEGESTDTDNYLVHRLRVADDRIRVLFVEHPPRYEYRYLKNALIRDNKILVHGLLTSADPGFPQEHTQNADDPRFREPLREFPRTLKDLLEYDVLVLGDVDLNAIGGLPTAEMIKKFVGEHGGGLLFLSGELHNPRSYAGTPLADLLPVFPDDSRRSFDPDSVYDRSFGYRVTPAGQIHEVLLNCWPALEGNLDRILEQWEDRDQRRDNLVGIRWYARTRGTKPNAHTLVEVTGTAQEAGGKNPPLFVVLSYSAGRVFWSGTDETWLWRYLCGDSPWFYPFWRQALYWSRQGKILGASRYRIHVDKELYQQSEVVRIFANAYTPDFEPRPEEHLTVYLEPPEGRRIEVILDKDKQTEEYRGEWTPTLLGRYKIWAGEDDENTRAYANFTVHVPNREETATEINLEVLEKIASESHQASGPDRKRPQFYAVDRAHELPGDIEKSDLSFTERKEDDLWDSPLVYLLFALLITMEWILRKIFRML